jgi:hypothetical protein
MWLVLIVPKVHLHHINQLVCSPFEAGQARILLLLSCPA